MYRVSNSVKDWIAEDSWPSKFKPASFLKEKIALFSDSLFYKNRKQETMFLFHINLNRPKKPRSNNSVILELVQRIPAQSLPQGSVPTQLDGLFPQDCMRDDSAVTAAVQFLLGKKYCHKETKFSNKSTRL